MNKLLILIVIVTLSPQSFSADRMCDKFDFLDCPDVFSGNRSSGASVPSQGASLSSVPASIANVDRTGVEVIKYVGSYDVNFVAGTGVVGSGFSTTNNEGTFFGNVPLESDAEYLVRRIRSDKFKSQKYNGVVALNLFGKSKRKKMFSASVGLVGKYNSKTSKPNGGIGTTLKFGPLSASYTRVRDDGRPDEDQIISYYSDTLSAGFKIANLAVDWTYIQNNTPTRTYAKIFSASLFFKKIMFTYGRRTEEHGHPSIVFSNEFVTVTDPTDTSRTFGFLGLQYMIKKRFIIGAYSNYYLNSDISLGFSAFF
ncbi:MAG: hypothetical protein CME70_04250 [Halobacteriovorax sp.]|nr:hypothetical protein [Halobacteriovorax sp.]